MQDTHSTFDPWQKLGASTRFVRSRLGVCLALALLGELLWVGLDRLMQMRGVDLPLRTAFHGLATLLWAFFAGAWLAPRAVRAAGVDLACFGLILITLGAGIFAAFLHTAGAARAMPFMLLALLTVVQSRMAMLPALIAGGHSIVQAARFSYDRMRGRHFHWIAVNLLVALPFIVARRLMGKGPPPVTGHVLSVLTCLLALPLPALFLEEY